MEDRAERFSKREFFLRLRIGNLRYVRLKICVTRSVGFAALGLAQESPEDQRQDHSGAAEEVEANAPAVIFREPSADPASEDGADIDAGLVEGKRTGAGAAVMVITGQGHAGGKIECFAEALERADGHKMPQFRARTRSDGYCAPEQAAAQDEVFAPEMVANESCERRPRGIDPHEGGADEAELDFVEGELLFQPGEDRENGLPICVVEKADEPKHGDNPPFVGAGQGTASQGQRGKARASLVPD